MKKGCILPVFKKGKKEHLGNYRLTSFTSWPGAVTKYILISKHMKNRTTETVSIYLARANCA